MNLFHVPPDGISMTPRPLSASPARRPETQALQEDLLWHGFAPDTPVLWLSPFPVSRSSDLVFVIDTDELDPEKLIPTGQAEGYVLHVGPIPQAAVTKAKGGGE